MKSIVRATAFAAAVTVASAFAGIGSAEAGCKDCKPASKTVVKTSTQYKTVQKVKNVVRYKDVTRVKHVNRVKNVTKNRYVNVVHRKVTVTRVQPVTRVHVVTRIRPVTKVNVVTRVRHVTVYQHKSQRAARTVMLKPRTVMMASTKMMPGRTMTSHKTVSVKGGSRNVKCGC